MEYLRNCIYVCRDCIWSIKEIVYLCAGIVYGVVKGLYTCVFRDCIPEE